MAELTKFCTKCKQWKLLVAFSKRTASIDGRCNRCKICLAEYVQRYYQINRIEIIEQTREYSQTHKVEIAEWGRSPAGKESRRKNDKNQRAKHPERIKAVNALNHAVRDNKIIRPDFCEHCDEKKFVEGHHADYSKHLDVAWLCLECHTELHKKLCLIKELEKEAVCL